MAFKSNFTVFQAVIASKPHFSLSSETKAILHCNVSQTQSRSKTKHSTLRFSTLDFKWNIMEPNGDGILLNNNKFALSRAYYAGLIQSLEPCRSYGSCLEVCLECS